MNNRSDIPHQDIQVDERIEAIKTLIAAIAGPSINYRWGDSAMDLGLKSKYPDVKKTCNSMGAQTGNK